mmetsp:Transcript_2623/g.5496  ORF Transcript_2623/g.5496 Transcript_2623/m.5496 type:complete len:249 (+) Transcript_2623:793-1539(+)
MSLCGLIQQSKEITVRAIDNRKRAGTVVEATLHLEHETFSLDVHHTEGEEFQYEFQWSNSKVGVGIVEIFFDGIQIPESPIRVQVIERDCEADFPGEHKISSGDGSCVCGSDTVNIQGKCVNTKTFYIAGSLGGMLIVTIIGYFILRWRTHKADSIWHIEPEDLHFDDPVEVIGQGSFGVVLLAVSKLLMVLFELKNRKCSSPIRHFLHNPPGISWHKGRHQARNQGRIKTWWLSSRKLAQRQDLWFP